TFMKKIWILGTVAMLAACNSGKNDEAKIESMKSETDSTSTKMDNISYPYTAQYSSKFEIGDPKNAQTILNLWKDWDNGNLSNSRNSFADSVELHFLDGSMMKGAKDSVIATAQKFRNSFKTVISRVDAVTPLKSTDKNEHWVCVWGMETDTDFKGKVDSFYLQETWRINKDGKTDLLYQFSAKANPPKK
ncbi:MAG: hypothetical protein M3O67_01645, partial [Bacteroidota bacterium]|nr:hypothetical protein [Bacteroidota bacterium]